MKPGARKTVVPAIPEIARGEDAVDRTLKALKEATEVGFGRRGDPLDRFVTLRELRDAGIATVGLGGPGGASLGGPGGTGAPVVQPGPPNFGGTDYTPPPAPTGVRARGIPPNSVMVTWDPPNYSNHAYAEVFVLLENSDGSPPTLSQLNLTSDLAGRADGTIFMHRDLVNVQRAGEDLLASLIAPAVRYYWVRFVSTANVRGPLAPLSGAPAAMSIDPVLVLDAMIANVRNTAIYQNLRGWIGTTQNDPILAAGGVRAYINQQDGNLNSTFTGYFNTVIGVSPAGFSGQSVFQRLDYIQAAAYPDHAYLQNLQTWQAGLTAAAVPAGTPVALQMLSYTRTAGASVVNVTLNQWSLNIASFPVGSTVKIDATAGDPLFGASGTRCVIVAHIPGGVSLGITPENTAILPVLTLGSAVTRRLQTDGPPQSAFLDFIATVQRNIFVSVEPGTALATALDSVSARIGVPGDAGAINLVPNGGFSDTGSWTTGAGWTIASGVATATSSNGQLSSAAAATVGKTYRLTYRITQTGGSVQASFGGKQGAARSATGSYTETFTSTTSTAALVFTGTGFSGTVDDVDLRDVSPSTGSLWAQTNALSSASVSLSGQLENLWSVNMRQEANGVTYAAGFGLSLETDTTTGRSVSTFLINANQFALMGPASQQKGAGVTGFYAVSAAPDVSAFIWLTTSAHGFVVGDKVALTAGSGTVRLTQQNLIANGTFTDSSAWSPGAGWSIAGGAATASNSNGQLISAFLPSLQRTYKLTYTITARTGGTVTPSMGGVFGVARSAPGTYTDTFAVTNTTALAFNGAAFSGSIDNVELVSGVDNPFGGMAGREGTVAFAGANAGQPFIQVVFAGASSDWRATPDWANPQQASYNRQWVERYSASALPASNIPFVVDTARGIIGIRGKLIIDGLVRATSGEFNELTATTAFIQQLQAEVVNANVVIGQRLIAGTPGSGALTPGAYSAISNFIVEMNNPVTNQYPLRYWKPSTGQTVFSLDRLGNMVVGGNMSVGANAVIATTGNNLFSMGGSGADGNYAMWCGPISGYGVNGGSRTEATGVFWIKDNGRAGFNADVFLGQNALTLPTTTGTGNPGALYSPANGNSVRATTLVQTAVSAAPVRIRALRGGQPATTVIMVSGLLIAHESGTSANGDEKRFWLYVEVIGSASPSAPTVATVAEILMDDYYPESMPFNVQNTVALPAGSYYVRLRVVRLNDRNMSIIQGWSVVALQATATGSLGPEPL